jgi:hypothetical protein
MCGIALRDEFGPPSVAPLLGILPHFLQGTFGFRKPLSRLLQIVFNARPRHGRCFARRFRFAQGLLEPCESNSHLLERPLVSPNRPTLPFGLFDHPQECDSALQATILFVGKDLILGQGLDFFLDLGALAYPLFQEVQLFLLFLELGGKLHKR